MSGIFRFHRQDGQALDRALDEWRGAEEAPERLSGPARERILEAAARGETRRARLELPSSLFLPARRFALAAVLPLLVLSVAVTYVLLPGEAGDPGSARLLASRQGDEVVFVIANGDRPHRVLKTTDPRGLEAGEPVEVRDGVFRDRLNSGTDLVFYRID